MPDPVITTLRSGDTSKPDPFTICIVANPALEAPWQTGQFIADPVMQSQPRFDACAGYIVAALFGNLPNQQNGILADPALAAKIRVVTVFATGLASTSANALIGTDSMSTILVPRRAVFTPFLAQFNLTADIVYAVSSSSAHTRASAWFTTDDDNRPGTPFMLDGTQFTHRFYNLIPGTIAIHDSAQSLTAVHEFGHALSSYSNGSVVDLYVDSDPALNCRQGRPIPPQFAAYNGSVMATDTARDSLGYPASWQSYHCALIDPGKPAVMDNYWQTPVPEACQHDQITRRFLVDRLNAKVGR